MNKSFLKKMIALMLSVCIVLSLSSCVERTVVEEYSDEDSQVTDSQSDDANVESNEATTSETSKVDSATGSTATSGTNSNKPATSSNSQSKTTTSLTKAQVMAKMPKSLKGTTLTYMYWWDPKNQMEGEAIKKFEKETGIKVKSIVVPYNDFQQELAARIAANQAPDLVRLLGNQSWQISSLQPITNSGFNFNDSAWDQQLMKDYTFNGNIYATNLKKSAISDVAVIYYNKKALEEADMEDPYTIWKKNPSKWTWKKFWSMCDEFVAANRKQSGYAGATFEYADAYVRSLGGGCYSFDASKGKFVNILGKKATSDGWKVTLDAIERGWLLNSHDETKFDQGKVLFFWSGPFSARKLDARQKALKDRNRLGVVPLPTDSQYQVMYEYTAFGIPQGAKNAAAAPYYLRYVLDQSSYNMDNVYYNAQAREVVDYACSKTNRFYGNGTVDGLRDALYAGGSKQVDSVLKSYQGAVQDFVNKDNERIKLFSK